MNGVIKSRICEDHEKKLKVYKTKLFLYKNKMNKKFDGT